MAEKKSEEKPSLRSTRPDLASILGLVVALGGIIGGLVLEGGKVSDVTQVTAAIIVLGGTLGAVMVTSPMAALLGAVKSLKKVFFEETVHPEAAVEEIIGYATKAREGKLKFEDLTGGTFTVSNGGVYGSLVSTPILNFPQSGILGMHKIMPRPVAVDGKVEIRPMMYLALSYDHRLIDGKEAVTFLIKVKECIEDPKKLPLDF